MAHEIFIQVCCACLCHYIILHWATPLQVILIDLLYVEFMTKMRISHNGSHAQPLKPMVGTVSIWVPQFKSDNSILMPIVKSDHLTAMALIHKVITMFKASKTNVSTHDWWLHFRYFVSCLSDLLFSDHLTLDNIYIRIFESAMIILVSKQ